MKYLGAGQVWLATNRYKNIKLPDWCEKRAKSQSENSGQSGEFRYCQSNKIKRRYLLDLV